MIKLIITDLDNTIYDWVEFYVRSFNAMIKEISLTTSISEEELKESFKRVHEKHNTTEYAFSIEELDVLSKINAKLSTKQLLEKYNNAIHAFRSMRKKTIKLYE